MLKCMKNNILLTQNLTTKNHDHYSGQFFLLGTHICMSVFRWERCFEAKFDFPLIWAELELDFINMMYQ